MKQMTEQHLINAFGGESMANMRYRHFSVQAEKESYTHVARLFRAISHAEYILPSLKSIYVVTNFISSIAFIGYAKLSASKHLL